MRLVGVRSLLLARSRLSSRHTHTTPLHRVPPSHPRALNASPPSLPSAASSPSPPDASANRAPQPDLPERGRGQEIARVGQTGRVQRGEVRHRVRVQREERPEPRRERHQKAREQRRSPDDVPSSRDPSLGSNRDGDALGAPDQILRDVRPGRRARADDEHALTGERARDAVLGRVRDGARERLDAGNVREIRRRELAGAHAHRVEVKHRRRRRR